jgi:hypothetical protein
MAAEVDIGNQSMTSSREEDQENRLDPFWVQTKAVFLTLGTAQEKTTLIRKQVLHLARIHASRSTARHTIALSKKIFMDSPVAGVKAPQHAGRKKPLFQNALKGQGKPCTKKGLCPWELHATVVSKATRVVFGMAIVEQRATIS